MTNYQEHERELVLSFIIPERRSHYLQLPGKPKHRKDITDSLAHFKHLDPKYIVPINSNEQDVPAILRLLRSNGESENCYVLSEDDELDGKELALAAALKEIVGRGIGTFLSCILGNLPYFEDEEGRWILERPS